MTRPHPSPFFSFLPFRLRTLGPPVKSTVPSPARPMKPNVRRASFFSRRTKGIERRITWLSEMRHPDCAPDDRPSAETPEKAPPTSHSRSRRVPRHQPLCDEITRVLPLPSKKEILADVNSLKASLLG